VQPTTSLRHVICITHPASTPVSSTLLSLLPYQVTELNPEFTAEGTSQAAGAYGKTVSYVLLGLRTAKVQQGRVGLGWAGQQQLQISSASQPQPATIHDAGIAVAAAAATLDTPCQGGCCTGVMQLPPAAAWACHMGLYMTI
jgi:hypothetical protein